MISSMKVLIGMINASRIFAVLESSEDILVIC